MTENRNAMMIRADAKASGMTTALTVRHSAPWSSMRDRAVGIATGDIPQDLQKVSSVRCIYADGTEAVRSVNSFKKPRGIKTGRTTHYTNPTIDAPHRITAADLAPITEGEY